MIINRHTAAYYQWGDQADGWHLVQSPEMSVIQERVPAGGSEVRHYHERAWQFFFILSGTATLEVDGQPYTLNAQDGLEVPAGTPHQFINASDDEVVFLVISHPPSHGDRIQVGL